MHKEWVPCLPLGINNIKLDNYCFKLKYGIIVYSSIFVTLLLSKAASYHWRDKRAFSNSPRNRTPHESRFIPIRLPRCSSLCKSSSKPYPEVSLSAAKSIWKFIWVDNTTTDRTISIGTTSESFVCLFNLNKYF